MPEHIKNTVRLEVDASDVTNLISNHSGQNGNTNGWTANLGTVGTSTLSGNPTLMFGLAAQPGDAFSFNFTALSTAMPILAGQWAGITATRAFNSVGNAYGGASGITLQWLNSSSIEISSVTIYKGHQAGSSLSVRGQAPAGATQFRVALYGGSNGSTAQWFYRQIMAVKASTEAAVTDVPFTTDTAIWQDMLGKSYSIRTQRGLDQDGVTDKPVTGTLTATLSDPNFDPVNNPRMRPGRKIRLTAATPGSAYTVLWQGRIASLENTAYETGNVVTTITATDAWAELANVKIAQGFGGTYKQRITNIMNQTAVPFTVADPAANITSVPIDSQDNATAVDQLVWARNALQGFIFVTPDNTLKAVAAGQLSSNSVTTFSDTNADTTAVKWTSIDTGYSSAALVNSVMVQRHNFDESEEGGNKLYGPWSNPASVASWGVSSATLETNDGNPDTLARAVLAIYNQPQIFASGLRFNARDHLTMALDLQIYHAVTVKVAKANLNAKYRILSIAHDITPDSWEVALGFRVMETPSTVTVTNPPGGVNTGPSDVIPPQPGILGSRYRSGTFAIPNNTFTTVPLNGVTTMDGISYDSTNNRFIVPRDGRYQINFSLRIGGGAGVRVGYVNVNSTSILEAVASGGAEDSVTASRAVKMVAGDVVSLIGFHIIGSTQSIYGGPGLHTFMDITYLGP